MPAVHPPSHQTAPVSHIKPLPALPNTKVIEQARSPEPTSGSPTDDRGWKRLQNILRRHETKQAVEQPKVVDESVPQNIQTVPEQPSVVMHPSSHEIPSVQKAAEHVEEKGEIPSPSVPLAESRIAAPPTPVSAQAAKTTSITTPLPSTAKLQRTELAAPTETSETPAQIAPQEQFVAQAEPVPQGIIQRIEQPQSKPATITSETKLPQSEKITPEIQITPEIHEETAVGSTLPSQDLEKKRVSPPLSAKVAMTPAAESSATKPSATKPSATEPSAAESFTTESPVDINVIEPPVEEQPTMQPLPLEVVWPVQTSPTIQRKGIDLPMKEVPLVASPTMKEVPPVVSPQVETPAPIQVEAPLPAQTETAERESIHQILQQVEPGQPTESSVEIITPRQPRPTAVQTKEVLEPQIGQPKGQIEPLEQQEIGQPATAIQRQPDQARKEHTPEIIPTDIGPLPSDLWTLLGQKPPEQVSSERYIPRPEPLPGDVVHETASVSRPQESRSTPPSSVIQRQADASQAEAPAGIPSTAGVQAPTQAPAGEQAPAESAPKSEQADKTAKGALAVNLEELSRRVYAEIRRRLSIERERIRR
jgi:hypothetical protein